MRFGSHEESFAPGISRRSDFRRMLPVARGDLQCMQVSPITERPILPVCQQHQWLPGDSSAAPGRIAVPEAPPVWRRSLRLTDHTLRESTGICRVCQAIARAHHSRSIQNINTTTQTPTRLHASPARTTPVALRLIFTEIPCCGSVQR